MLGRVNKKNLVRRAANLSVVRTCQNIPQESIGIKIIYHIPQAAHRHLGDAGVNTNLYRWGIFFRPNVMAFCHFCC